jgi:hypothetical protein
LRGRAKEKAKLGGSGVQISVVDLLKSPDPRRCYRSERCGHLANRLFQSKLRHLRDHLYASKTKPMRMAA